MVNTVKPSTITDSQRKLHFALINDIRKSGKDLIVSLNGVLIPVPLYAITTDEAYNLLKQLDLDYPRKKGKPESMARGKISTKDMASHTEWLRVSAQECGIKLPFYEAELKRLSNFSHQDTIIHE